MGETVEGRGLGRGLCPLPRKNWIFTWKWWVLVHSRIIFFTFMQKLVRPMGGGGRPPGSATVLSCCSYVLVRSSNRHRLHSSRPHVSIVLGGSDCNTAYGSRAFSVAPPRIWNNANSCRSTCDLWESILVKKRSKSYFFTDLLMTILTTEPLYNSC